MANVTHDPARQAAVNALFAAANHCPQANQYPTFAQYTAAFEAYQAGTMQPLRDKLAAATEHERRQWAYTNLVPLYSYEELANTSDEDLALLVEAQA